MAKAFKALSMHDDEKIPMSTHAELSTTEQRKILVAVDFGLFCTCQQMSINHSHCHWQELHTPVLLGYKLGMQTSKEARFVVRSWDSSGQGGTAEKVPTTLVYDRADRSTPRWGFDVDEMEPKHEWFKLDLDPTREGGRSELAVQFPSFLPSPRQGVSTIDLVTDYLRALRRHMDNYLQLTLPGNLAQKIPKEYILTVPAVWSPSAWDATLTCASNAGLGSKDSIHVITEPEAAALYELDQRAKLQLRVGDTFVVCDAGGGTVDLISYTVENVHPTISLREATSGSGQACGSTFVNRIFAKYLNDKFQNDPEWSDDILVEAMARFEVIKRQFSKDRRGPFQIRLFSPLRNDPSRRINRGRLSLTKKEIVGFFEPVVTKIIELVNGQIQSTQENVKEVILVGGFGTNVYLRERLQDEVAKTVKVKQSLEPWTAVVRGALLRGLAEIKPTFATPKVPSRVARKHIGVNIMNDFEEGYDPARIEFNTYSGKDQVKIMEWIVKKGEVVQEADPQKIRYYWERPKSRGRPTMIAMEIFDCSAGNAPVYKTDSVKSLVEAKADLSLIPEDKFDQVKGADNLWYYKVDYLLEMTCKSGRIDFALIYKDKKYDIVTAHYVTRIV
ncbi:hypothetical protein PV11_04960 [Exophiala sideris]|uniref:Actin-like ATPase domain-containing protein n=1 Tax=Exophiala sideris TaxID=1016849 RepID=A0A0D1YNX6_9EURO|nr:hypothetical protein PV11_04960 [Exophiala sideris]